MSGADLRRRGGQAPRRSRNGRAAAAAAPDLRWGRWGSLRWRRQAPAGSSGAAVRAFATGGASPAAMSAAAAPAAATVCGSSCFSACFLRARSFAPALPSAFGLLDGALRACARATRASLGAGGRSQADRTGEPLAELRKRERRNQVDGDDDGRGGGQQRAGQVQRIHQISAPAQAQRSAQRGWRRRRACSGRNDKPGAQRSASAAPRPNTLTAPASMASERIHLQASANISSGKQKRRRAEDLQEEIGEIGAGIADQVERARSGGGVPGGVLGVVRHQAQQHHQAQRQQQEPGDFVQPLVLGRR